MRIIVISPATCRDETDSEPRGELRHEHAHLAEGGPWPSLLLMGAGVMLALPLLAVGAGKTPTTLWSTFFGITCVLGLIAFAVAGRINRGREYAADNRAAQTSAGHADVTAMLRRIERI